MIIARRDWGRRDTDGLARQACIIPPPKMGAAKRCGGLIQIKAEPPAPRFNPPIGAPVPPPSQARELGAEGFMPSAPIFV
jgi:hypothetical protein